MTVLGGNGVPVLLLPAGDRLVPAGLPVRGAAAALHHLHPAGPVQADSAHRLRRAPPLLRRQRSRVPAAPEVGTRVPLNSTLTHET